MKKLLSIALCATAVSAFAETVTELGQVGVTAITNSLQNTIVAVSYDDLDSSVESGIVVSNLVKTTNLTVGDQLAVFNGGEYTTWILTKGEGDAKFWAKNDKTFTVKADGQLEAGTGPAASEITKAVGTGIWLCRKEKPSESFTFYIYGKPVSDPVSDISANTWTLIGNPTQAAVDLQNLTIEGTISTGDQIVAIDTDGSPKYYTYKEVKGWQRNDGGKAVLLPPIGAGLGVWVRAANSVKIHWTAAQQ